MRVAVIGGTGVYRAAGVEGVAPLTVQTPYGAVTLQQGRRGDREVLFLPRHGEGHSVPPHRVNYRANVHALWQLEVEAVLATSSVGSLLPEWTPGMLLLLTGFLDFTRNRPHTFFDGDGGRVVHTDMTEPYCPRLRGRVADAARTRGITVVPKGTYVGVEGPRFESPQEIRMFAALGGDVVGMTGIPEVTLFKEAGLCYQSVGLVTNLGAGLSPTPISHDEVVRTMAESVERVTELILSTLDTIERGPCPHCRRREVLA